MIQENKVSFELEKNKTKEFYMRGKVGMIEIPKSKELEVKSPSIIKQKETKIKNN